MSKIRIKKEGEYYRYDGKLYHPDKLCEIIDAKRLSNQLIREQLLATHNDTSTDGLRTWLLGVSPVMWLCRRTWE